ncbi:hypothetical protein [Gloeocapsopsis dulcis]|uniref:Uncharacterized protein n=1 Tax=Gloeocapsopsis dulcis AAB1 = 1H9 TaxID=1433147 RepID=A0A6N8G164_9CHRO|nr:hypothetical protein [Gloeocapsopsis dulcis]MUL38724.1 hypothetical protein [Gloeocapsopsis dulcis AAB1 = 1H9]WNN88857.1 hypothetical protein P0S91_21735 [Gloeocapsopsis dulcis]
MERGILWLALLAVFIWLAWQGKNEYQKVENYRVWAEQFERAKYDIYAVLGQKESNLTWGKPTQKGLIELQTFSLKDVQSIQLLIDNHPIDIDDLPHKGREVVLEFLLPSTTIHIPFTEIPLAAEWGKFLQQELQRLQLEPSE